MGKTTTATEIWVTTTNETGALTKLTASLAEAKVNIYGFCGWTEGTEAKFRFLTDNNDKTLELWNTAGYTTTTSEVVVTELEDKPGTTWNTAQTLSNAGISVNYMYVTTCGDCPITRAVFNCDNNTKAAELLG